MSNDLKIEYINILRKRYQNSSKATKSYILTELCENIGISRKHAIRLMNQKASNRKKPPGRKKKYSDIAIQHLKKLWLAMNQINSKKIVAALPYWLKFYNCGQLIKDELLSMSHATIDRKLKSHKVAYRRKLRSGTRPGTIRHIIPIKPFNYNINEPGFVEADTVAHCGGSMSGDFAWSLTLTDIESGWTENRAIWGKGAIGVLEAIKDIEQSLPFEIIAFNCDNGTEFLNYHLISYFGPSKEKQRLQNIMTRSREYRKNDNCHVEQKNWTHVRELFGYERIDNIELISLMNDIYAIEHSLLQNFFIPQVKLKSKTRVGSKYKKTYTKPTTPYHRIINSDSITDEIKEKLIDCYNSLNPFEIQNSLRNKLNNFFKKTYKKTEEKNIS